MTTVQIIFLFIFNIFNYVKCGIELEVKNPALDNSLYESVLDSKLCDEQLRYINSENLILRAQFLDAGLRLPRGILDLNFDDLGNYHQCLGIREQVENYEVTGKYCLVDIPFEQEIKIPQLETPLPDWTSSRKQSYFTKEDFETVEDFRNLISQYKILAGSDGIFDETPAVNISTLNLQLALCIPRPCTTQQALANLYLDVSSTDLKYNDVYCRLPDDKPWTPADTVAVTILSIIGILTLLSTCYDVHHTVIKDRAVLERPPIWNIKNINHKNRRINNKLREEIKNELNVDDPRKAKKMITAFSVYTNTRNFFNFKSIPGSIECLDGIRALAMAWVIILHTFSTMMMIPMYNPLDAAAWFSSTKSLWLQAGQLSVDTFFMLSGLLLVYSTAGKFAGIKLLKNLHLFYLNRLLRLFPVLAFSIVLQISILNRISDGPLWPQLVAPATENCRTYWWSTLLHLQTYLNSKYMCIPHSWYVTVDTHLHILSPLVLFWILSGNRKLAWISLVSGLTVALITSSIYIFINNFSNVVSATLEQQNRYSSHYYINTLTRAPPFFLGMIFGYILHVWRGKQIKIPKVTVGILWISAFAASALIVYSSVLNKTPDYDIQTLENFRHAYARTIWIAAIGWMVLACVHGYSGPINWILSLQQLKPLGRLSYAMYLLHYPMMFVYISSQLQPFYFSTGSVAYIFLSHFAITIIVGFLATILIDAPFGTLIKLVLPAGL